MFEPWLKQQNIKNNGSNWLKLRKTERVTPKIPEQLQWHGHACANISSPW